MLANKLSILQSIAPRFPSLVTLYKDYSSCSLSYPWHFILITVLLVQGMQSGILQRMRNSSTAEVLPKTVERQSVQAVTN